MTTKQLGANALALPRWRQIGPIYMDGTVISTLSQSASEQYQLFQIPTQVYVLGGIIKGSQPTGASGQAIFKLGTAKGDATFGTYTISGGAALATRITVLGPLTISSSGSIYAYPVIATVQSGASATTSLSLYVMLEYVAYGNIGTTQKTS